MLLVGRLALEFGIPVFELIERLHPLELSFWEAFERVEGPIGYRRTDALASWNLWINNRVMKDESKPTEAFGILYQFLAELYQPAIDRIDDRDLQKGIEEAEQERLKRKVLAVLGAPPEIIEKAGL